MARSFLAVHIIKLSTYPHQFHPYICFCQNKSMQKKPARSGRKKVTNLKILLKETWKGR